MFILITLHMDVCRNHYYNLAYHLLESEYVVPYGNGIADLPGATA